MKLYLAHNKDLAFEEQLRKFIEAEAPSVELISYDESYTDDKKRANRLKGGFSARMSPFAVLKTNEEKFIKAFYSEVNDCTYSNLTHNLLYYGSKRNKQIQQPVA